MITLLEQNAAQLTENIFLAKFFDLATYLGVQLCSSWKKKNEHDPTFGAQLKFRFSEKATQISPDRPQGFDVTVRSRMKSESKNWKSFQNPKMIMPKLRYAVLKFMRLEQIWSIILYLLNNALNWIKQSSATLYVQECRPVFLGQS